MKIIAVIAPLAIVGFFLSGYEASAQGGANLNNNNVVGWNNIPTNITNERVDYSDVKGNCYWNKDWLPAHITLLDGSVYELPQAKLNLYSNNLHYINEKGVELASKSKAKLIVFHSSFDKNNHLALFKPFTDPNAPGKEAYAQVMVEGAYQFLKLTTVKMQKFETDPLLKTEEYSFDSKDKYFIEEKGQVHKLSSLDKRHLFEIVPKQEGDEEWLKNQGSKLRNEEEIIAFLTYRNSKTQGKGL